MYSNLESPVVSVGLIVVATGWFESSSVEWTDGVGARSVVKGRMGACL